MKTRTPRNEPDTYVIYKGDEVLVVGTAAECARYMNVEVNTVKFYATNVHKKRVAASANPEERLIAERVRDER